MSDCSYGSYLAVVVMGTLASEAASDLEIELRYDEIHAMKSSEIALKSRLCSSRHFHLLDDQKGLQIKCLFTKLGEQSDQPLKYRELDVAQSEDG